jgi:hypothetical protein
MIKDQEALARWIKARAEIARREAIAAGSRIDGARAAGLSSQGRSIDWIESHRPMRSAGQGWGDSSKPYRPMAAPKMIKSAR